MSASQRLTVVTTEDAPQNEELRAFFVVLYRALRMICSYLEKRYGF